ncbi:hypothetical protein KM043_009332 [Ampulex compressa]|nr:hypothetical protein KM043_009332 [Ampulex compressa]
MEPILLDVRAHIPTLRQPEIPARSPLLTSSRSPLGAYFLPTTEILLRGPPVTHCYPSPPPKSATTFSDHYADLSRERVEFSTESSSVAADRPSTLADGHGDGCEPVRVRRRPLQRPWHRCSTDHDLHPSPRSGGSGGGYAGAAIVLPSPATPSASTFEPSLRHHLHVKQIRGMLDGGSLAKETPDLGLATGN